MPSLLKLCLLALGMSFGLSGSVFAQATDCAPAECYAVAAAKFNSATQTIKELQEKIEKIQKANADADTTIAALQKAIKALQSNPSYVFGSGPNSVGDNANTTRRTA